MKEVNKVILRPMLSWEMDVKLCMMIIVVWCLFVY